MTVGEVVASKADGFPVGQWVSGLNAIEEYSVSQAGGFSAPIDPTIVPSPTNFLSVLGAVGMTAYFGYLEVCKPQPGDVVLVTGAAGAVGSLVGQIAKIMGASKVIGIAGGPEKCARLVERYGFDVAIDYRGKDVDQLSAEIAAAAPNGVNVIFENVGGELDAVTGMRVTFAAFPWRWTKGDGCIVRLVAIVDPSGQYRIETGK
jgi:NADPH-dependent curcumin reductase CurA